MNEPIKITRAEANRVEVRNAAACPVCNARRGAYCIREDGGVRLRNHLERLEDAGIDVGGIPWGNQRARAYQIRTYKARQRRRNVPGGWGA